AYVGEPLAYLVAFTGFTVNLASANTGVVGVSRIVFSMAKYSQMPSWFNQIHPRFRTPTRSILFFGGIGMALTFLGGLEKVADLYTFAALITYVFVNLSILRLRKLDREAYRPWKSPTFLDKPLTGVIGSIAALIILVLMVVFHPIGRSLGTLWLATGLLLYSAYRKTKGLPVTGRLHADEVRPAAYKMEVLVIVPPGIPAEVAAKVLMEYFDRRHRLFLTDLVSAEDLEEMRQLEELALSHLEEVASILRRTGYEVTVFVVKGDESSLAKEAEPYDFVAMFGRGKLKGKAYRLPKTLLERVRGRLVVMRVR
ncbi:MAG: APC family permease, partial [Candidatus Korarchaeota archaeon]|nr:APC family permease [Candidatus Korarchaeota archaeon]